jgi:hypothetical protein
VTFDLNGLSLDPLPPPRPILPTISLGLDEIFVTDANFKVAPRLGEFMPVLEVILVRRGIKHPPSIFSLS